jgi:hypothetical protein
MRGAEVSCSLLLRGFKYPNDAKEVIVRATWSRQAGTVFDKLAFDLVPYATIFTVGH